MNYIKIKKNILSSLSEIWKGSLDSLDFFPFQIHTSTDRLIIPLTFGIFIFHSILSLFLNENLFYYWIYLLLLYNECMNIMVYIHRFLINDDKNKGIKISKIVTSRILLWIFYVMIPSIDSINDWLYFPLNVILLSWSTSAWTFDLALTLEGKNISFRTSYFRDRFLYYLGYGLPCGLALYMESYGILTILHLFCIYSNAVTTNDNKPLYARWIPHQTNKIPTELEEYLEYVITSVLEYIGKRLSAKKPK